MLNLVGSALGTKILYEFGYYSKKKKPKYLI